MGAWGVQLYQSDVALDVKGQFEVWSRIPGSTRELVRSVAKTSGGPEDPTDEDYGDVWLALADQLHAHGLHDDETFARAREAIAGFDTSALARAYSPSDAARRRKVLADLIERWSKPHPRPKTRKLLKEPERHAFEPGTIIAYPTCGGEPKNYADTSNRLGWFADGWGSAIILAAGHIHEWFAWTAAARLDVHGPNLPRLSDCLAAAIENQPWHASPSGEGTLAMHVAALPPVHAKRMGMTALGSVDLDPDALKLLDPPIAPPKTVPPPTLFSVFTWWGPGVSPLRERRDDNLAVPRGVEPLARLARQPT